MHSVMLACSAIIVMIPFCTSLSVSSDILDRTELLMTFLTHRHGDRTPLSSSMQYATDPDKVYEAVEKYGYGQLTNVGRLNGYKLGGFIRQRYNDFLSTQYNRSEIFIRSTDSTRAKMTVLLAMSAVYPLQEAWCEGVEGCLDINWTPVPYTTESSVYDFNLAGVNCPEYIRTSNEIYNRPAPQMAKFADLLDKWSNIVGINITETPGVAYWLHDVYTSQISLGIPLTTELQEIYPEIEEAAGVSMAMIYAGENAALGAGVLLNEFFVAADSIVSGEDIPRVRIYSAHDTNVIALMGVTKVPISGVPKYASAYALELRRDLITGQIGVLPVSRKSPESNDVTYLQVEGCEEFCELTKFREIVAENLLEEKAWREKCQWTEDYDFDLSLIN